MPYKGIYNLLKETGRIREEIIRNNPHRVNAKAMGYMWEGEMTAMLLDGTHVRFYFWHHFHDDDGDTWYPSETDLANAWRAKFVPSEPKIDSKSVSASDHTIYSEDGEHVFISKTGFFPDFYDTKRKSATARINDGTWKDDSDIWQFI